MSSDPTNNYDSSAVSADQADAVPEDSGSQTVPVPATTGQDLDVSALLDRVNEFGLNAPGTTPDDEVEPETRDGSSETSSMVSAASLDNLGVNSKTDGLLSTEQLIREELDGTELTTQGEEIGHFLFKQARDE